MRAGRLPLRDPEDGERHAGADEHDRDDKGAAAVAALGEGNARYFRTDVTSEDGAAEKFRQVQEAYDVLADEQFHAA